MPEIRHSSKSTTYPSMEQAARAYAAHHGHVMRGGYVFAEGKALARGWSAYARLLEQAGQIVQVPGGWTVPALAGEQAPALAPAAIDEAGVVAEYERIGALLSEGKIGAEEAQQGIEAAWQHFTPAPSTPPPAPSTPPPAPSTPPPAPSTPPPAPSTPPPAPSTPPPSMASPGEPGALVIPAPVYTPASPPPPAMSTTDAGAALDLAERPATDEAPAHGWAKLLSEDEAERRLASPRTNYAVVLDGKGARIRETTGSLIAWALGGERFKDAADALDFLADRLPADEVARVVVEGEPPPPAGASELETAAARARSIYATVYRPAIEAALPPASPEEVALAAHHKAIEPTFAAAARAEQAGRYSQAADLYDQVAAHYGEHGSIYRKAAARCRRLEAGPAAPAQPPAPRSATTRPLPAAGELPPAVPIILRPVSSRSCLRTPAARTAPRKASATTKPRWQQIRLFLIENEPDLYVKAVYCTVRAGLARGDRALELARDLVQDLHGEALRTAEHYDPASVPLFFWLTTILWTLAARRQGLGGELPPAAPITPRPAPPRPRPTNTTPPRVYTRA